MNKISVIIPVYNVKNYLKRCLDSLINQTFFNEVEIILIDDGSTDGSELICDDFTKKYYNIITIHQHNTGPAIARNNGIKIAKGDYIMFVDSDDYIDDLELIKKIIEIIIEDNPDLIMYGYKKIFDDSNKIISKKLLDKRKEWNINYLIQTNFYKDCPWNKIIKKSFLIQNNIFFPNNMLSEDIDFCAKILLNINLQRIKIINENPYVYTQRKKTISKSISAKHVNDIYEMLKMNYIYTENKNNIVNNFLAYEYVMSLGIINSKLKPINLDVKIVKQFYSLKSLLNYDLCKKVKFVKIIESIFGIKITSKLLGIFINLKVK